MPARRNGMDASHSPRSGGRGGGGGEADAGSPNGIKIPKRKRGGQAAQWSGGFKSLRSPDEGGRIQRRG